MPTTFEPTQELVRHINQSHGLRFVLRERCPEGLAGAWLLSDDDGRRAILKINTDMAHRMEQLPRLVDRVRAAGYPTPRWLAAGETADGTTYHVVDFVSGESMLRSRLTLRTVEHLIEVIERQAGLDPDPTENWSEYVWECAFGDGENDPRPMTRRLGQSGIELIARFEALLAPYVELKLPRHDMVHGDLNNSNVMCQNGEITGVIDAESLGSGTRALDYATLLPRLLQQGASPEIISAVRRAGREVAGPGVFAACGAAVAFDSVRSIYYQGRDQEPGVFAGVLADLHHFATVLTDA
ncbi:phosphotransferase [Microlunatus parietis]|uniref:Aminoglycoside phosphotransferase (APT) family kinase protein n=1 Tax=Microlunatus parietis TaxID=682979 RepID=A0A7Y9I1S8_9ACTN|nr:phosphotransferase [Microlunatus parietis]NYE68673.1 aminoglycoside phosphotransferase (APT) family kinase protein [Microlunatus parietis]